MWIQGQIAKFKTDLVIALSGSAMTDGIRTFQPGNFDLPFGDKWSGQRRTQQVLAVIYGIGAKGRKDVIFDETSALAQ